MSVWLNMCGHPEKREIGKKQYRCCQPYSFQVTSLKVQYKHTSNKRPLGYIAEYPEAEMARSITRFAQALIIVQPSLKDC